MKEIDVPILYLIFNRFEETKQSFEKIRQLKPRKLYISADGPRSEVLGERELCKKVRNYVFNSIDWNCEVNTLLHDTNLGSGTAPNQAMKWFFDEVESGVIIEDDILVTEAFYKYASLMLEKYKDDNSIISISGNSLGLNLSEIGLGKTNYFNMWGWATWKRSFDLVQSCWSGETTINIYMSESILKNLRLFRYMDNKAWFDYWNNIFIKLKIDHKKIWDYQWLYTSLKHNKKTIYPTRIMVQNIGFGKNATHTKDRSLEYKFGKPIKTHNLSDKQLYTMKLVNIYFYEYLYMFRIWNMFELDNRYINKKNIYYTVMSTLEYYLYKLITIRFRFENYCSNPQF